MLPRSGLDTVVVVVEVEEEEVGDKVEERRGVSLGIRDPCGLS
jgi:hypothetical protein